MSWELTANFREVLNLYFPMWARRLNKGSDIYQAVAGADRALVEQGSLSWSRLNEVLHRCSEAGMSEGFFRYYFLEVNEEHPYPVDRVFSDNSFRPPEANEICSIHQLEWGVRRFRYDAILYWGNFRQAYRELRQLSFDEIAAVFASKRVNEGRMIRRGKVEEATSIPKDHRYLISEMACKTYDSEATPEKAQHVKLALEAFRTLREKGQEVTPEILKEKTQELAKNHGQLGLFDLMYEDAGNTITNETEVIALYSGQSQAFRDARATALENTRIYLSICSDLDLYVATSMRNRQDFRDMADVCERIFRSDALRKYNIRYFDPTLSASQYHEDKGIIECLMVKTAKVLLYFAQHKESFGKVSECAMALSLGKPVIILCPDDMRGQELYRFYREAHPLTRLIEFETGTVNGAMITHKIDDATKLLEKIFSNNMEYDLDKKPGTDAYYLLKERLTGTTVRVVTDARLLTETFWNNWHGIF